TTSPKSAVVERAVVPTGEGHAPEGRSSKKVTKRLDSSERRKRRERTRVGPSANLRGVRRAQVQAAWREDAIEPERSDLREVRRVQPLGRTREEPALEEVAATLDEARELVARLHALRDHRDVQLLRRTDE